MITLCLVLMAAETCSCSDPWGAHELGFLWEGPPFSGPLHRAVAERWEQPA